MHHASARRKNPFIPINCPAIPDNLLEATLFGTSKGTFTGAIEKAGLVLLPKTSERSQMLLERFNRGLRRLRESGKIDEYLQPK
jgi:arginine utilization regulatory protein